MIAAITLSTSELSDLLCSPYREEIVLDTAVLIVALEAEIDSDIRAGMLPLVIIGVTDDVDRAGNPAACDLVVHADDPHLLSIVQNIEAHPLAAAALAVLLRAEPTDVETGLAAESAVYSLLQAGPEFTRWRASSTARAADDRGRPAVLVDRVGDRLTIELDRPQRHNAFSASMRDELCDALGLAALDDSIESIDLSGRGPSFCSGGDLGEFGSFPDPATAHRTRLARSPAALMHRVADRTTVSLHGACMGAGIELSAFAARVRATPDAAIALPEVKLGLVPGAGGTVSIPRRIGRHRTAYLALIGHPISGQTAFEWGLVDELHELVDDDRAGEEPPTAR